MPAWYLKLGHDRFLHILFHLLFACEPFIRRYIVLVTEKASLNKVQIRQQAHEKCLQCVVSSSQNFLLSFNGSGSSSFIKGLNALTSLATVSYSRRSLLTDSKTVAEEEPEDTDVRFWQRDLTNCVITHADRSKDSDNERSGSMLKINVHITCWKSLCHSRLRNIVRQRSTLTVVHSKSFLWFSYLSRLRDHMWQGSFIFLLSLYTFYTSNSLMLSCNECVNYAAAKIKSDGESTHLWNVGLLQRDYMVLYHRRVSSSKSVLFLDVT
jgi:hypothetical protein